MEKGSHGNHLLCKNLVLGLYVQRAKNASKIKWRGRKKNTRQERGDGGRIRKGFRNQESQRAGAGRDLCVLRHLPWRALESM